MSAVALGVGVVGALGPWVNFLGFTAWGFQGDGWFLALPLALALLIVVGSPTAMFRAPYVGRVPLTVAALALSGLGLVAVAWKLIPTVGSPTGLALAWGLPVAGLASIVAGSSIVVGTRLDPLVWRRIGRALVILSLVLWTVFAAWSYQSQYGTGTAWCSREYAAANPQLCATARVSDTPGVSSGDYLLFGTPYVLGAGTLFALRGTGSTQKDHSRRKVRFWALGGLLAWAAVALLAGIPPILALGGVVVGIVAVGAVWNR